MNKKNEVLESNICQLTIAYLSNIEKANYDKDKEIIEFNDEKITFEMLNEYFFDNNFRSFEVNEKYADSDDLMILNKTIKNYEPSVMKILRVDNFKLNSNRMNFIDILSNKFISNKKVKIDPISKISFIKDVNKYNSLYDFKIYNQFLSLNDIISYLYQNCNKDEKTHIRIKIIANYYSVELNEEINMSFNFLVEIPRNNQPTKKNKKLDFEDEVPKQKKSTNDDLNQYINLVYSQYNASNESNECDDISVSCDNSGVFDNGLTSDSSMGGDTSVRSDVINSYINESPDDEY
jgi:hypothetical protein